jgi:hypothetical protein
MDAGKFVSTSRIGITSASLNGDRNELTLTVNRNLSANGEYDGAKLWLQADILKDKDGKSEFVVGDEIDPELTDVLWGVDRGYGTVYTFENTITLVFNEKVKPETLVGTGEDAFNKAWNDVISLDIDGKSEVNGSADTSDYYWEFTESGPDNDGNYYVNIEMLGQKKIESKDVTVVHRPYGGKRIVDLSDNLLSGFNKTISVRYGGKP